MDLLNRFKETFYESSNKPSKVTIKNYLSDIRKFIQWYQTTYSRPFAPTVITTETIEAYLRPLRNNSYKSAKRYESSLRKFFAFMVKEGKLTTNPLLGNIQDTRAKADPWHLKDFKNYLYVSKSSNLTIKNYINDIQQFLLWLSRDNTQNDVFANISSFRIDEYKNILLYEARLSPLSVNRKLSSLRKYIAWAVGRGIIKNRHIETQRVLITQQKPLVSTPGGLVEDDTPALTLEDLKTSPTLNSAKVNTTEAPSGFGPLRMLRRVKKASGFLLDSLFILSVIKSIEAIKYNLWKSAGKEVFAPLSSMVSIPSKVQEKLSIASPLPHTSALDKFITIGHDRNTSDLSRIRSIPKSIYAPLKISTNSLPFWKKAIYRIKHNRPEWYKRYHSYPVVHYLHFALALAFASFFGFTLFKAFTGNIAPQKIIMASKSSPSRLIAFQGRLNDISNNPITRESPVRFAIYSSPDSPVTSVLWQENQEIVPDQEGNFSTILGRKSKISQDIFINNPHLYLGISIGSDPELTPRLELETSGLTKNAQELQGLKPLTGNNANTANVILALDSSGNLTIGGSANPTFQATGGEFKLSGQQLTLSTNIGSNTNVVIIPDGTGMIDLQKPLQNTSNNNNLLPALGAVEVDDNFAILATSSAQSALIINQNSTGDLISATTRGSARFTVTNQGSGEFASDLNILGNNLNTTSNTFNLINTNAQNINIGGAATSLSIGASTGTTTINHNLKVSGILNASGGINLPQFSPGSIPFINTSNQLSEDRLNFSWDANNKRLGIGTGLPSYKLSVMDNMPGGAVTSITNITGSDSVSTSVLRLNTGVNAQGTSARFITFYADCGNENCQGTGVGNIHQVSGGIALQSGTADFAERFYVTEPTEAGDLIGSNTESNRKAIIGDSILGVVSDSAIIIGNSPDKIQESTHPIVGLIGQVRTKVTTEAGDIHKGDFLTISATPGVAQKANQAGQALGTALENFTGSGTGRILVLVRPGWYQPEANISDSGDTNQAGTSNGPQSYENTALNYEKLAASIQDFVSTLKTGVIVAKSISTQSLSVATEDITIGGQTLRNYIISIVTDIVDRRIAQETPKNTITIVNPIAVSETASVSANVTPAPSLSSSPSPSPSPTPVAPTPNITNVINVYNSVSSPSATPSPSESPAPSPSPTPTSDPTPTIAPSSAIPTPTQPEFTSPDSSPSGALASTLLTADKTLNTNYPKVATYSAELAYIPNLKSDFATFENGVIALGPTSLSDTSIDGELSVGRNLRLTENSINTFGSDLNLQPLRQGSLSIMGGLIAIDTEGNLSVQGNATFAKDVTVKGRLAANVIVPVPNQDLVFQVGTDKDQNDPKSKLRVNDSGGNDVLSINHLGDLVASGSGKFAGLKIIRGAQADTSFTETVASGSAGFATITAHETERTIFTPFVNADSLIYLTPSSSTQGETPYIARQTNEDRTTGSRGSFTIQLSRPVASDIKLNWWIVN